MRAARGSAACLAAYRNDRTEQNCVNFDACSVRPAAHRFPMLSNASANALCWTSTQKPADERAERKPRFVYRMDGSALFRRGDFTESGVDAPLPA